MSYIDPFNRPLPAQGQSKVKHQLTRFDRAVRAHKKWADDATLCQKFLEGDQWDEDAKQKLTEEGRPVLTINKIMRLMNLVKGYHTQQRFETTILPTNDGLSTGTIAEVMAQVVKSILDDNRYEFVESQMFQDGIASARGYLDIRLDFSRNYLGEVAISAADPFATYPDPDAMTYDPAGWNFVFTSKWMSLETVAMIYGVEGAEAARVQSTAYPNMSVVTENDGDDRGPPRMFGLYTIMESDRDFLADWLPGGNYSLTDYVDRGQKTIRVIEQQHMMMKRCRYFMDTATGNTVEIPVEWTEEHIAETVVRMEQSGKQLKIIGRVEKRPRWTVTAGDTLLYDDWSIYDDFTILLFSPYFRRGVTRGLIHDLLDPQREINKRRSAQLNIVNRTANSGWLYSDQTFDEENEEKLEEFGSTPGVKLRYRAGQEKPEQIDPNPPPMAMERLEDKANNDLREVSGINESALGEIETVQSGIAIQNRQRQTIVALEPIMQRMKETRMLLGDRIVKLIQRFYNEPRIIRVNGADQKPIELVINQVLATQEIVNDLTAGRYITKIESMPAHDTFMARQFAQILEMFKIGAIPPEMADLLIEYADIPNKANVKARLAQLMMMQPPGGGGKTPPKGGSGGTPKALAGGA